MSEFKGTKGKWKLIKTPKGHHYISGEGWDEFCKVYRITEGGFDGFGIVSKANAKLIAAAPEILEMLEELIYLFKGENNSLDETKLLEQAEQLINKATEL